MNFPKENRRKIKGVPFTIFISGQNDQEHLINLEVVLLRENVPWKWGKKDKDSFERVKRLLCLFRLLAHYDTMLPFIIVCDICPYGIEGIILL